MEKVCLRIPNLKKTEFLELAKKWRAEDTDLRQGWDYKAVHRIAKEKFGGLEGFFTANGSFEQGSQQMQIVQSRVKEKFGSIEKFVELYDQLLVNVKKSLLSLGAAHCTSQTHFYRHR